MAEATPAQVHRSEDGVVIAVTAPRGHVEQKFDEVLEFVRKKIDVDQELMITHDEQGDKVVFVHPEFTINTRRKPLTKE